VAGSKERRERRWALVKFGLFAALTTGLIGLIGAQIARIGMDDGYSLVAVFDDVSGLHPGDQVKIAGAPVGQVEDIQVVTGRAQVTMSVQRGVRIPVDSEAAVRWRNAIGQRVVYLLPGERRRYLADGGRIGKTHSVVDIGALIADLGPLTRSLDPEQINRLLLAAGQALDGTQRKIPELVANLERLTGTVAERKEIIQALLKDYATVSHVVARRDEQIAELIDNLVVLTEAFARNRELIDEALVEVSTTVSVSDQVLGENAEELGAVVDRLTRLTGGIRRNVGTIERALNTFTPPFQRSHQVTGRGEFAATAVPCLALNPVPCPYPMRTPPPIRESAKLTDASSLRRVMVGDGG
jgi:phospholipid/cholesterol/gamma-HCH transport system substrate-binding protein